MYLKSIELTGFKSFADKTQLNFQPGITSVVGPNGSGKSNISDAIRWVMGEMSAKALRGGAMQDVIFAGTQTRKPLGYACVSLTLDNSDRGLNIDFSEVTITRRVYRSGESEYLINSSPCRLKDIHELLMDTGLGRDGYSIIGQGKVNEIISGKSEERRNMLDEAAGISKFRHKKTEAQRKLEQTSDNLLRISDIVSELGGRLEPLRKQSEKAKKYLGYYEEYKTIDINIFLDFAEKYKNTKDELVQNFNAICGDVENQEKAVEEFVKKENELNEKAADIDLKLDSMREDSGKTQLWAKSISGEIDVLLNTITSGEKMIERIENEKNALKVKIESYDKKRKEIKNEEEDKRLILAKAQTELDEIAGKEQLISKQLIKTAGDINGKKSDIVDLLNETSDSKSKLSSLEAFKESFVARKDAICEQRRDSASELESLNKKKSDLSDMIEKGKNELFNLNDRLEEKKAQQKEKTQEAQKLHEQTVSAENEFNKLYSRLHMLTEMERDFEGLTKSTKTVLNAAKNGTLKNCGICGILSSVIDTQKKYVTAIEAALGGALGNVITENEFDAKEAINFLKKTGGGRVTFLPITSVKGRTLDNVNEISAQKGFVALASDVIKTDKKYEGIIKSLLGRTVIAQDMDTAVYLSRKFAYRFKTVTLEGEILNAGGSITGGSINKTTGLLSRASEIKELKEKTQKLRTEIDEQKRLSNLLRNEIESINEIVEKLSNESFERRQELVKLNSDFSHIDILIDSAKNSDGGAKDELETIEEQIKSANEEIAVLINETTSQEFKAEKLKNEIADLESQADIMGNERDALNELINKKTLAINDKKHEITSLESEFERLKEFEKSDVISIGEKEKDISDIILKNEQAKQEVAQKRMLALEAGGKIEELIKKTEELESEKNKTKELAVKANNEERKAREKLYLLKEEQNRLDLKREKLDEEMESASAKMWDSYEITYNTALPYKRTDFLPSEAKKRANELKTLIKQLGNINLDAMEEYEDVFKRHEFLSAQVNDLTDAKTQLENLIEQITVQMKEQFTQQFEIINEKFTETFSLLFGGGRASLYLSDPKDVLESGIEIEAQPPGKSLKNLSLLSGGEMAFTAIALLFAILKVRPTPFCVLDEIEAALDEPNVYRFADYLKIYCKNTQFILVTHRRGTMEAANLLYGVTMQEKGVSKLLSIKLDEAKNLQN